jgi:hypothetical protein
VPLAHFNSSLRVAYAGREISAIYIPVGLIDSGNTKHSIPSFVAATPHLLRAALFWEIFL